MSEVEWCLKFKVNSKCSITKARSSTMQLHHGEVHTPVFMPVGTQGTIKGLTVKQLNEIKLQIILGNTYHLGTRPGPEIIEKAGGLHKFMNWPNCILTDSGGFQMVSLSKLSAVSEEGVEFMHPVDKTKIMLTPEKSMEIQKSLGSDIVMQLDDVVSSLTTGPRVEEAMFRSIRWLDRALCTFENGTKQNLFAIIQGGLDANLRKSCLEDMTKRNVPGFAIGGLSGGEAKEEFWKIVSQCTDYLPVDKPRYLMGVGYAPDLLMCSALGCDMFDCVYPTRTARFGTALTFTGELRLKQSQYRNDFSPIDNDCLCYTCKNFSRSYLNTLMDTNSAAFSLISIHNLTFQQSFMSRIRQNIENDQFPKFMCNFLNNYYPSNLPTWINDCLGKFNIDIDSYC